MAPFFSSSLSLDPRPLRKYTDDDIADVLSLSEKAAAAAENSPSAIKGREGEGKIAGAGKERREKKRVSETRACNSRAESRPLREISSVGELVLVGFGRTYVGFEIFILF